MIVARTKAKMKCLIDEQRIASIQQVNGGSEVVIYDMAETALIKIELMNSFDEVASAVRKLRYRSWWGGYVHWVDLT